MKYVREHNTSLSGVDAGKELYENLQVYVQNKHQILFMTRICKVYARYKPVYRYVDCNTSSSDFLLSEFCVGRAIRHRADWAALILIDQRYGTPRIRSKLPGWIGTELEVAEKFGDAIRHLGEFFRGKKGQ
jgi:hypothetical protein